MEKFVIAFGGNALLRNGDVPSFQSQYERAVEAFNGIWEILEDNSVVITHGNGPQVGNILLQNENSKNIVPSMPLHACGSMSMGLIGHIMSLAYDSVRLQQGYSKEPVVIITRTVVSDDDPAFSNPSKPIGPFYKKQEADSLMNDLKWSMKEDSGRGWRRLVPSPAPMDIMERNSIIRLLADGFQPIAVGGGGIPVVRRNGKFVGVDAVIDKDLASSLLASIIDAHSFMILTDVPFAYTNYGSKDQEKIGRIKLDEIQDLYSRGFFASGSMGPKIKAAMEFVRKGGKRSIITSIENSRKASMEQTGTIVLPN
ncbi:carbamate kinase [Oxyplasma meridianum]|uniref:Carbamate kinase n=1 Tax=Oxyplasma meridianum TaxID=3073602 RepID=A0AAX4NDA9_9ARCH